MRDWVDFGVICGLLLLNATVGFFQELQAGSIVDELKKTLALKAVAIRNGKLVDISASEVVPGDILQVEEACRTTIPTMSPLTAHRVPSCLQTAGYCRTTPFFKSINRPLRVNPWRLTSIKAIPALLHRPSSVVKLASSYLPLVITPLSVALLP